jgi:hypothetical protein
MLLHENTDTANYPPYIRRKIYEVEKLVRLGQRLGVQVYTNCLYESDFLQWVVSYDQQNDELFIILRSLDSISVPVEKYEIHNLTLSQLAAKLAELELIY